MAAVRCGKVKAARTEAEMCMWYGIGIQSISATRQSQKKINHMKRLLLFAFTTVMISGTVMAQTAKQEEKKDLRTAVEIKRDQQKAMVNDAAHLRLKKAHGHKEAADALRDKGVKHPVKAVRKKLHKEHEAAEKKIGQ
jgi:hypothetical protein